MAKDEVSPPLTEKEFDEELAKLQKIDKNEFSSEDLEAIDKETMAWEKEFEEQSINNVLAQEEIYPKFIPRLNAIYTVSIQTLPEYISKIDSYVMDIDNNGMRQTMYCNRSFLFGLKTQKERKNLKSSQLIGREMVVQKAMGTIKGKKVPLMRVQLK